MPSSRTGEEDNKEVVKAEGEVEARAGVDPQMEGRQLIDATTMV